ncbi:S8 family serine peptidase [Nocardioides aequoreus]|uniref:S8 family serine peptidase n=1 Tax=Nocardioides aequoreus TaxID=397278 RepID=UPI0005684B18|nr:S8 family serine peptidase [Nocardioides aequoreus]
MPRRALAGLSGAAVLATCLTLTTQSPTGAAEPDPAAADPGATRPSLGLGLQDLVGKGEDVAAPRGSSAAGVRLAPEKLAARDARGRLRVTATPADGVDHAAYRGLAEDAGLRVTATDDAQGSLEGFATDETVATLAGLAETGTLNLSTAPAAMRGDATSQGVRLQRADRVQRRGIDGSGITIGALSDSYDQAAYTVTGEELTVRAADDVTSGDLPDDVVVLEDYEDPESVVDEGRAMLQIAHDVAPGARLCFATAYTGLLGFADNVRRLADPDDDCGADVLVDDIVYFEEPAFSDSVLTDAIDDVAADGVHYFSAIGNQGEQAAWDGRLRLVGPRAARSVDLSQVPPELYDGGLVDLDQSAGTDVAQDLDLGPSGSWFNLQWDDPVDLDGPTLGEPWLDVQGETSEEEPFAEYQLEVTPDRVGEPVVIRADSLPSGAADLVLAVYDEDGEEVATVDQATSPETLATSFAEAGTYTVYVFEYSYGASGPFSLTVAPVAEPSDVGTDLNLLFFDRAGDYLFSLSDDNELTGRPQELSFVEGEGQVQVVVSRSGTGPLTATRMRHLIFGDAAMTEHVDPMAPATIGHAYARGSTAVAAYDAFRPFGTNFITSPGGDLPVMFDSQGERLRRTEVRRVPQVAATDGGNNTFFGIDNARDDDDQPNFFGTSAAAPHAAAIAALVLDRAGGGQRLSPAQLRKRLERTAFLHDLDPNESSGRSGGIELSASGGQGYELRPSAPLSMVDDEFFTLDYSGGVPLRSLTLYGETASPTAPGERGLLSDGLVFDPRPLPTEPGTWREGGFPFTVGGVAGGVRATEVSASYSRAAGDGQFRRMTLRFDGGLRKGEQVRFGIDRDLAVSGFSGAEEGNGADELGGAVFYPQDLPVPIGMAFEGVRTDGRKVYGVMRNDLGRGWTPLDGHGLVDAETAVFG